MGRTAHRRPRRAIAVAVLVMLTGAATLMTACAGDEPERVSFVAAPARGEVRAAEETPTPTPEPVVRQVVETEPIAFDRLAADDPNLPRGQVVVTPGADGLRTVTYDVTTVDGRETRRAVVSDVVTTAPVSEVTTTGTYDPPPPPVAAPAASSCDGNYADACVPIASDVDCAGGSGNGPAYLEGTARVVGADVYDLDRDKNGYACD